MYWEKPNSEVRDEAECTDVRDTEFYNKMLTAVSMSGNVVRKEIQWS